MNNKIRIYIVPIFERWDDMIVYCGALSRKVPNVIDKQLERSIGFVPVFSRLEDAKQYVEEYKEKHGIDVDILTFVIDSDKENIENKEKT